MNRLKKSMAVLLCALLMAGVLPMTALAAGIQADVSTLTVNDTGTTIAFAGKEWYVISDGSTGAAVNSGHLTLLAKDSFGNSTFRNYTSGSYEGSFADPSDYNDSTLMHAMATATDALPTSEAALITARSLDGIGGTAVSGQKLWPLSLTEYNAMGTLSGDAFSNFFWLRSPYYGYDAFVGFPGGGTNNDPSVDNPYIAVRPALHLNLSSVLFTSDATAGSGKSSATVGGGLVGALAPSGKLKFTMEDTTQTLRVLATSVQTTQTGSTLAFSYDSATSGTNQYVSCVLEQSGAVTHYGKLTDSNAAASGTLSIPLGGVSDGVYTLKIFSEQANGDLYTDFAGTPITMDLTVSSGQGTVSNFGGTTLSDNAGLASVAGQTVTAGSEAGTSAAPKTASISVANSLAQVVLGDIIASDSANATVALYSDSGFTTAASPIALTAGGATHLYIKVTAQDGVTELYYDVTVNRAAAPLPSQYNVTVTANPAAGGSPTASPASAAQGASITLTANPATNYRFDSWTVTSGGITVIGNSFTMPDSAVSITANYTYIGGGGSDPGPTYTQRTLTDPATGVTASGLFTADAALKVVQNGLHPQGTCTACDEIRTTAGARGGFVSLHDIGLASGSYNGDLTISIPVNAVYNGKALDILHCKLNHVETLTATAQNGAATFTVSSLSPFAVVAQAAGKHNPDTGGIGVPQTGDDSNIGLWVAILVISLLVCGFATVQLVRKRRALSRR